MASGCPRSGRVAAAPRHWLKDAPIAGGVADGPWGNDQTQAPFSKTGAKPSAMVKKPDA
jgi:hypothetical protein